jgi:peptidyl-prolyl cis-trans isomerase-like 2
MGKKQHQKDRLFITSKEWKEEWGGYKDKAHAPHQNLPFNCCAISFTPFEDPVCTEDGTVFDVTNIVPYISKHHSHPVTGAPLQLGDLIPVTFHKNGDGEYECPILKKVFTRVREASSRPAQNRVCNILYLWPVSKCLHWYCTTLAGECQ